MSGRLAVDPRKNPPHASAHGQGLVALPRWGADRDASDPVFIVLGTALGASSSFVTVGASVVEFFEPGIRAIRYAAGHLDGAKNRWQVALVAGIALGAFASPGLQPPVGAVPAE